MLFAFIFLAIFSPEVLSYTTPKPEVDEIHPESVSLQLDDIAALSITNGSTSCYSTNKIVSPVCEPITQLDYGPTGASKTVNFQLTRGMESGTVVDIVAAVTKTAQFNIRDIDGNILLHVIAHIDINNFHFNANNDGGKVGGWGSRENLAQMPIKSGIKFNLLISYESNGYHIYVDGEEVHFFKHRMHKPITAFQSFGGQIFSVTYKQNEPKWAVLQQRPIHGLYMQEFENGKGSPHEIQLQGCHTLSWVVITGIVNSNANGFILNLVAPSGDIVLHFRPRFAENFIVCNSFIKDVWGKEENTIGVPFLKNQKFVLAIDVETDFYRIYVNGHEIITYNHRVPVNLVTKLEIGHGLTLFKIKYYK